MALKSYQYGNPANHIDFKRNDKFADVEVLDCGGCENKVIWLGAPYCTEGQKVLQRCDKYAKGDK